MLTMSKGSFVSFGKVNGMLYPQTCDYGTVQKNNCAPGLEGMRYIIGTKKIAPRIS